MQIAYHAKYPQLVCVVFLLFIVRNVAKTCDSNNQKSATFESNLKVVVNNLVRNISSPTYFNTSVYGESPDTVYGLFQCAGGATVEECSNCSQDTANQIRESCENARSYRNLTFKCFLRYEDYSFFGILDNTIFTTYYTVNVTDEPDVFRAAVRELFSDLSDGALQSPLRYSTGQTTISPIITIYSLVQCWRDLTSVEDCKTCLARRQDELLNVTFRADGTSRGGCTYSGSCVVRYERDIFFHPSPPTPSSPIQLLSPQPPSPIQLLSPPPLSPSTASNMHINYH